MIPRDPQRIENDAKTLANQIREGDLASERAVMHVMCGYIEELAHAVDTLGRRVEALELQK